jgi:acetolactate synthase I/II/III large subunit
MPAIAMKRLDPDRKVISVNGDGDFLMRGQELQYRLPIAIVCETGFFGTIRTHRERDCRVVATDLQGTDFRGPMREPSAVSA